MKFLLKKLSSSIFGFILICSCQTNLINGPYLATGIKIGEVTQTEAIIWVRLTKDSARVGNDAPFPDVKYIDPETGELVERRGRRSMTPGR